MNISLVRRHFQKAWNFSVLTSHNVDLTQAYYSLQQESLVSDKMFLYVSFNTSPQLDGSLIELNGQKWLVSKNMKELANTELYEYHLYPATDVLELIEQNTVSNDLGININSVGTIYSIPCYFTIYSTKERVGQPVEANQQTFFIAANSMPNINGVYTLRYKGLNYKINSYETAVGIVQIKATWNL